MARKLKHHQRDKKFEVVYPIDSDEALFRAIADDGAEQFRAAAEGDQTAVKPAINAALLFLALHRDTREQLPRSLCDWLLRGLEAAARGQSMEVAMGLRRRGARNTWSQCEKKRALVLLWAVRDYIKTRPHLKGTDYHEITAQWFSEDVVPSDLTGWATGRASTSWVAMPDGSSPFKTVTAHTLAEWERQAIRVGTKAAN